MTKSSFDTSDFEQSPSQHSPGFMKRTTTFAVEDAGIAPPICPLNTSEVTGGSHGQFSDPVHPLPAFSGHENGPPICRADGRAETLVLPEVLLNQGQKGVCG